MTAGEAQVVFWERTDVSGLERLELRRAADVMTAGSTVVCVEDGGFRLDHRWRLTPGWSVLSVEVEKHGPSGLQRLALARDGAGWTVDGIWRPDLLGAEEPDLSVTPFCNSFPLRGLPPGAGATRTLDTCYVDAASMTVVRSRQRYERLGSARVRYVDLGTAAGFEAIVDIGDDGLVDEYEGLFRRIDSHG